MIATAHTVDGVTIVELVYPIQNSDFGYKTTRAENDKALLRFLQVVNNLPGDPYRTELKLVGPEEYLRPAPMPTRGKNKGKGKSEAAAASASSGAAAAAAAPHS